MGVGMRPVRTPMRCFKDWAVRTVLGGNRLPVELRLAVFRSMALSAASSWLRAGTLSTPSMASVASSTSASSQPSTP
eukprot:352817-Chlamydomonas_euryale.AAC.3